MKIKVILIGLVLAFATGIIVIAITGISYQPVTEDELGEGVHFSLAVALEDDSFVFSDAKGFSWFDKEQDIPLRDLRISVPARSQVHVSNLRIVHDKPEPDSELMQQAEFLFHVMREDEKIVLESLKGTDWTQLSFGCENQPCEKKITNKGIESNKQSYWFKIGVFGVDAGQN